MKRILLSLTVFLLFSSVCFAIDNSPQYNYNTSTKRRAEYQIPSFQEGVQLHPINADTSVDSETIVLSFVACEDRFDEAIKLMKSVLLFTKRAIHFVVITTESIEPLKYKMLMKWRKLTKNQFSFEVHEPKYPTTDTTYWQNLYAPCATLRLFYPKTLVHLDAVIYMDVDTLLLGPVEELWRQFKMFNEDQIAALVPDIPLNRYAKAQFPYYGVNGVNSGIMLMNLTRMRTFNWMEYITPIMMKWKEGIHGDQDIINILFHFNPHALFVLPCRYNFHPGHCNFGCQSAVTSGVFVLHGTSSSFLQPSVFMALYQAISEYRIGTKPTERVVFNMEKYITEVPLQFDRSNCRIWKNNILKIPLETIKSLLKDEREGQKL